MKRDLINKLRAEKITSLCDSELERCLNGCVGFIKLLALAKTLRDNGELTLIDLI